MPELPEGRIQAGKGIPELPEGRIEAGKGIPVTRAAITR
jgi:hypothetical protein